MGRTHVTTETVRYGASGNIEGAQRGPALYTRCSAMLDIGGADAGAGGMSISSGSGGAGASGMGASSPSSDSSAIAIPLGLRERAPARSVSRTSRQWRAARWPFQRPRCVRAIDAIRSVTARGAHPFDGCRRHALLITTSSNEPSSTERASVAVACAWMQLLKLR